MKPKKNERKKPKITKEVLKKAVAGVLIPAVLMPSCSKYFIDENEVVRINNQNPDNNLGMDNPTKSVTVPIFLSNEDMRFLGFLENLVTDILENPKIAKKLAENPQAIAQSYGVQDLRINFDDELWQLIIALGDEDLHNAAINQNIPLFFSLCEDMGLISEVKKSDIVKYFNEIFEGEDPGETVGIVIAVVVGIIAGAVAGIGVGYIVGGVAAGIAALATFIWDSTRGDSSAMVLRDPQAYQLWVLKNGNTNTQILLSEYKEKIINDCIDVLFKYFPEKAKEIDIEKFRQFIILNMPY